MAFLSKRMRANGFVDDAPANQEAELIAINLEDMLGAVGLRTESRLAPVARRLFWPAAARFAREIAAYDAAVGRDGLQAASTVLLRTYTRTMQVRGQHMIPAHGPVLVVANHPGIYDTVALFSSIPRADLRTVAAERPFLTALPNLSARLLYVPEQATGRLGLLRNLTRLLRDGGAALTFPGGTIEPDPAVMPGAAAALTGWSESITLLARLVPHLHIVPAIVSGIISTRALHHPLTRIRRNPRDREWLAAMLQIQFTSLRTDTASIAFGAPICADSLPDGTDSVADAVVESARNLIHTCKQVPQVAAGMSGAYLAEGN